MKFKHMLFVLTVTTSIIFACMLGSSYAYYTLSNGTTVTATTGEFDANVSVVFSESEYINLKTLSVKEIKYKLLSKGLERKLIEKVKNTSKMYKNNLYFMLAIISMLWYYI